MKNFKALQGPTIIGFPSQDRFAVAPSGHCGTESVRHGQDDSKGLGATG